MQQMTIKFTYRVQINLDETVKIAQHFQNNVQTSDYESLMKAHQG